MPSAATLARPDTSGVDGLCAGDVGETNDVDDATRASPTTTAAVAAFSLPSTGAGMFLARLLDGGGVR